MANNFLKIVHYESEITTVGGLLNRTDAGKLIFNMTASELMNFKGDTDKTNRERVFDKYTWPEKNENESTSDSNLPLKVGTELIVPNNKLSRETLIALSPNIIKSTDATAFMAKKIVEIHRDSGYIQVNKLTPHLGTEKTFVPQITVWMWCRSLSPGQIDSNSDTQSLNISSEEGLPGSFIDISPFIQSINIQQGDGGGNFSFALAPILAEINSEGIWTFKEGTINNYNSNQSNASYESTSNFHFLNKDRQLKESQFYFHTIISENDLVFIRFETLEVEKRKRLQESLGKGITKGYLPGNIYDMIGLVDANRKSDKFNQNEISSEITITGRDLTKTIIEDGSYFYPLEFAKGVFYNASKRNRGKFESGLIQRNVASGELLSINAYTERSIQFTLQFVINQLSNTGLVPNSIFNAYGSVIDEEGQVKDKRSKKFNLQESDSEITAENLKGVWQIMKLIVDDSVADRRLVDSSIATEQGSLINSINKICQKPFVEFFTDTYGDQFYLIARVPPFDREKLINILEGSVKTLEGNVDDSILKSRSKDASRLSVSERVKSLKSTRNEGRSEITRTFEGTLVIDVESYDILEKELMYENAEVYTWYKLQPKAFLWGEADEMALAYLPAIHLPKYEEVWGSRPYDLTITYQPFRAINDKSQRQRQNYLERQSFYDLKWMIDTTAHLPFTRKGTIVINGDRRIKRGMFIRLKGTDEIFYVDNVSNFYSKTTEGVERTTTIQVSRGMIEPYIKGVYLNLNGKEQLVSYFNIVDTTLDEKLFEVSEDGERNLNENVLAKFGVNEDIFEFFFRKQQLNRRWLAQ